MTIVAVVLALRLYTRLRVTKHFGLDDVFAILATVSAYVGISVLLYSTCD